MRKASPDSFVGLRPCSCVDPFYLLFLKIGTNIPNFQFKGQLPPLLNVELNNIFKTCSSWDLHDNDVIAARFFSFLGDLTALIISLLDIGSSSSGRAAAIGTVYWVSLTVTYASFSVREHKS